MENISNFFKNLGDRLSSPLFYSFLLAWLIINWKIPIGIILYDGKEISSVGYNSFFDLIYKNLNSTNAFGKPLVAAILFTFGYPFIKNCIHAFNTWIRTWGNKWNLKLAKESKISVEKYIQLREVYKKRSDLLENVLENEGKNLQELEKQRNKALQLINEKNDVYHELNCWKTISDISQIEGEWELKYLSKEGNPIYRMRIRHNVMEYVDNPSFDVNSQIQIKQFYRHPNLSYLTFTTYKQDKDRNGSYHFFRLDILDDMKLLRGVEDDQYKVELRKKSN
jgi:hypothetical protein